MNRKVLLLLASVIIINAIFNGVFQLHYDEAYYWVWGQNLSLSYFDHPPMIGYLIRLTTMFGHSEFFVRLPALITSVVTILIIYALAKKMFGQAVANIAAMLAIACPIIEAVAFVVTPDSPLLMFWALTLYFFYIGVFENSVKSIYLSGLFAGCALLSKYTAILIFPGLFLFIITSKRHWQYLLRKDIYLAFILAFIVFSPVIIWNYQHHFASFLFQLRHGMDQGRTLNIHTFLDYLGGQLLVASPVVFLALLYYIIRYFKPTIFNDKLAFLFWPFIFTVGFFGYCGLFQHQEANWPGPAYVSGIVFLAYWLAKFNNKWVHRFSVVLIFIILVLTKLPTLFTPARFHNRVPALNIFYGNKEMLSKVKPYLTPDTVVLGCDYGNASRAWYYLGLKRTYVLDKFPFANTYRYWNDDLQMPIKRAIYVCDGNDLVALEALHYYFKSVKLLDVATFSNSITDNKAYIYLGQ